ncbi:MAG: hypothetical protein QW561_04535, partial [Candidatus Aenigmatarchaeota archaeon]
MKAAVSVMIEAIFAIGVALVVLVLIIPRIFVPTAQVYGKEQADALARVIALSINGLGGVEKGNATLTFAAEWDVKIEMAGLLKKRYQVRVVHEKIKSDPASIMLDMGGEKEFKNI